jgi:hypothetical protein
MQIQNALVLRDLPDCDMAMAVHAEWLAEGGIRQRGGFPAQGRAPKKAQGRSEFTEKRHQ